MFNLIKSTLNRLKKLYLFIILQLLDSSQPGCVYENTILFEFDGLVNIRILNLSVYFSTFLVSA